MSRFFQAGSSDSESDSSDEELYGTSEAEQKSEEESSEEESEEEEEESSEEESSDDEAGAGAKGPGYYMKNKFLKKDAGGESSSESESEEEGKKVVKSAKDKLIDEIDGAIKAIENAKKINDWVAISSEFDKINKLVDRAQKQYSTLPKQFVKMCAELETFAQESSKNEKSAKKKMNASNSRALNTLKQRIKKVNREHEDKVSAYRQDPDGFMSEKPSAAASAKPSPSPSPAPGKKTPFAAPAAAAQADDEGFSTVGKGGKVSEVTSESVFQVLMTIVESRGKKNADKADQVRTLEGLVDVCNTPYQTISVLLMLIPIRFDLTASGSVMSTANWKAAEKDVRKLFTVLEENIAAYRVSEYASEPEDLEAGPVAGADGIKEIPGSVISLVERLDDELTRALQMIDPHTTEYVDRMKDESDLYELMLWAQLYLESTISESQNKSETLSRLLVRRLEHVYFKPTSVIITTEVESWKRISSKLDSKITPKVTSASGLGQEYTIELINSICSVLYQQSNTVFRTKAMLSQIYHYALNDNYFKARDMFLMSHLQSSIHSAESSVQVLFNRSLVQVGLCAFRIGLISEAQQSLQEMCSSSRLKELLGQGVTKYNQPHSVPDKQRLLPFHMHINLELLECVYLTASLLVEIPTMASLGATSIDAKKKVISKPFRRMLDYHDRQVFTGPPENTRDHIMQAAKALLNGDWTLARDLLTSIKIWSLMAKPDDIKSMLTQKLQQEGLRTYLFSYGSYYQSLSLGTLASLFELSERRVAAIVSKMVANEEIPAALDQKTNAVVFRQGVELSKLQLLAQSLADRAVQLAERNERLAAGGHQLSSDPKPSGGSAQASNQQGGAGSGGASAKKSQQSKPTQHQQQARPVRA
jgi:translation initiation factor 3 subunit C